MKDDSRQELDALDFMLIKELEVNGRQTNTDLAAKLGTSKATVRRKLQRLLDENIINIVALANPPALGYKTMAFLGVKVQPGEVDAVADRLASYGNVHTIIINTGQYDIIAWMMFRRPKDLSDFIIIELGKIPGIVSTETMVNLKITKASFAFLGEGDHFGQDAPTD